MTKKTKLVILIPLGAAVLNGLGYLVAINLRTPTGAAGPAAVSQDGRTASAQRIPEDRPSERSADDREKEDKALARRAAGLAALEAGDYDRALAAFAEARAVAGDKAYVSELMRVTEDLARRQAMPRRVAAAPRPPAPPPAPHPAARPKPVERAIARELSPPSEAPLPVPAPAPATSGLLLVTTTPRGLLVQVDDVPVDLTPTRASLTIGSHRVALFDGHRKVYETNVDVKAGAPTTLLRDLSAAAAPATGSNALAAPLAKEDVSRPASPGEGPAPVRLVQAAMASPPPPPTAAALTGALEITSPGLYGEVWINGRRWGFPPLHADDLPPGPTRIGVRVNGVEERSATVAVRPGLTTSVRLNH